jgi:hypothetical protein
LVFLEEFGDMNLPRQLFQNYLCFLFVTPDAVFHKYGRAIAGQRPLFRRPVREVLETWGVMWRIL